MFNTLLHLSDCNILGFSPPFTALASEAPQEDARFSAQACTSCNHDDRTQKIRQTGIPQQFKQRESCAEYHGRKKIMSRRLPKPLSSLLAIPWWFSGLKLLDLKSLKCWTKHTERRWRKASFRQTTRSVFSVDSSKRNKHQENNDLWKSNYLPAPTNTSACSGVCHQTQGKAFLWITRNQKD